MKRFFDHVEQMDQLIRHKNTGIPAEFGHRLGLSARQVQTYIQVMQERGAQIKYDRQRQTYYYSFEGKFMAAFISG